MDQDLTRRREEAIAWFSARRAGVMSVDQEQAYDAWRADPQNQAALDAIHEKWGELSALKELNSEGKRRVDMRPRLAMIAAGFVAIFGLGVLWMQMHPSRMIETAIGQQKTQSLPDGSIMALNVVSKASYEINESKRIVHLDAGEAAFTVHPDKERPFTVKTGGYEVMAIGTAFNVRQRDGLLEVAVSEGQVAICRSSGANAGEVLAELKAGQSLSFPLALLEGDELPRPRQVPPNTVAEWRSRAVSYEDASVGEVVEDFNRYFERQLFVDEQELREKRVTVRLQVEDRDRAIRTLAILLDGKVRIREDGDHLEK